jgi:hypothetical protein
MAGFEWTGQDTGTNQVKLVDVGTRLGWYGAAFNDAIETSEYNDSMHVEDNANVEICATAHLHNTKFIAAGSIDVDGGNGGALGAAMPPTTACPIIVLFGHDSAVSTSDTTIWAYNGTTDATAPVDITCQCGEQSNATWTNIGGNGNAMALADDSAAATHTFYLFASVSPTAVGVKEELALRLQLTYS